MTYIPLINNLSDLIELLEDSTVTIQDLINAISERTVTMQDFDKTNKAIIKKYGNKNITTHKFPCDNDCRYAAYAHSECICLYDYVRPNFNSL